MIDEVNKLLIAVDAMGGDYAPREVIKGAIEAAREFPIDIALVGNKPVLEMLLRRYSRKKNISIIEASQVVEQDEDQVQGVQNKPNSSVVVGVNLVKDGIADGFVSAGGTGATVVASFLNLKAVEGVERLALCAVAYLNQPQPTLIIDAGVNVNCRPIFLVQFAQLASILAEKVIDISSPKVGLLNIGSEELKGSTLAKEAHQLIKKTDLNFIGNIEGFDVLQGKADVIVTDGFTGNVLVKTIEGYSQVIQNLLELGQAAQIDRYLTGAALAQYMQLNATVKNLDYKEYGGACLVGLEGNIVVAHGRSRAKAITSAIYLAYHAAKQGIVEAIKNGKYASE
ncbi:MAG: phosphate acyltransferase PlsX [Chloroflexota bacterium]|nr:MAG: phosphate acyltransferase PlsX [Chloroflexota bacterium]